MYKLFKKDIKLFFKDRRYVVLTFILPIILITLFAFAFGGIGSSEHKVKSKVLLVVDLDQSDESANLIQVLDSVKGLSLVNSDFKTAKEQINKGKYIAAIVFHKDFSKTVNTTKDLAIEVLYDKAREVEVGMLQPVLISKIMTTIGKNRVTSNIEQYLDKSFPNIDSAVREKIMNDVKTKPIGESSESESLITMTSVVGEKHETNIGLVQAVAGTAILMLLFSVAGLGTSILEEKEDGTLKRLIYAPINATHILYGKMLFAFFIGILQLSLMFVFSWLVLGLNIFVNIPALLIMIVVTAFAVSGFGIFLAAVSKTRQQAQSLSTLIILIMSAIGGSMIPLFVMPEIMQKIAVFSVNYWGIQGFYDIFWRELPLLQILPRVLVLFGIGLSLTLVSVQLFKKNILKLI